MKNLWQKDYTFDELIERFTVGNDRSVDQKLIYYDCLGSIAHAAMLLKIGILTVQEFSDLHKALVAMSQQAQEGTFIISPEDEDVHTAIEKALIMKLGDSGKKIHTARSRNDQVLVDLRLYLRDQLLELIYQVLACSTMFLNKAEEYKTIPIPGRTHFQKAMPSSLGLLFGAYAETLLDDIELLKGAYNLINTSPLGSAAGYGVSLPIDRHFVAQMLGFASVQNNTLYVSNSRGKFESILLNGLMHIMIDLSKISTDLIIFSAPEFGYFSLPENLCSGSSLMPQKKNPDVLELIRAKSAMILGNFVGILALIRDLPSGYHRDFQETKEPVMHSLEQTIYSLTILTYVMNAIVVNKQVCISACTPEIFATDEAMELVRTGIPFRAAYKQIAQQKQRVHNPQENIMLKTHQGAPGNLELDRSYQRIMQYQLWTDSTKKTIQQTFNNLITLEDNYD